MTIRRGSFVGAGATVLAGCSIGPGAFVGAARIVNRDLDPADYDLRLVDFFCSRLGVERPVPALDDRRVA